jgi:hypothetical protein
MEFGSGTISQVTLTVVGTGTDPDAACQLEKMTRAAEANVSQGAAFKKSAEARKALNAAEADLSRVSGEVAEARAKIRPMILAGKLTDAEAQQEKIQSLTRRVGFLAERVAVLGAASSQADRELQSAKADARAGVRHQAHKAATEARQKALQAIAAVAAGPLDALLASESLFHQIQAQAAHDQAEAEKRRQAVAV